MSSNKVERKLEIEDDSLVSNINNLKPQKPVVIVLNENKKQTRRRTSTQETKKIKKQNTNATNRILPMNNRIRSVFEIVRNRLSFNNNNNNTNSMRNTTTTTTTSSNNSDSALTSNTKKIANKTSNSHNKRELNANESVCQLCFNECALTDNNNVQQQQQSVINYMYSLETCEHSFCVDCLRKYLMYQITESRVSVSCPECPEKMHPNDIYRLLSINLSDTSSLINNSTSQNSHSNTLNNSYSNLIQKYEDFMLRRVLVTIPDIRWCPAPDCTYAVIATGCANCPQLKCMRPNCNTYFCYHCKQYWHPNLTCEDAALKNNHIGLSSILNNAQEFGFQIQPANNSNNNNNTLNNNNNNNTIKLRSLLQRSNSHLSQTSLNNISSILTTTRNTNGEWVKEEIKPCPKCQALIVKMDDGSCNHITCSVCGCEFCWLCMKEISDLHYLSPSGCTFWGKKPWSRKKKIMWQLGTLIGAPVGIALIAGVAVPAILIGLPIWSGRKVYIRYKSMGKHKRNLIVVGTVFGTILVAPLVAALAVGIGVPILLAYVYGVVPISLCRSGGCGVTTNNNGGVRLAFDDEINDAQTNFNFPVSNNNQINNNISTQNSNSKKESEKVIKLNQQDESIYFNSVTVPISAIEPRPDSVVVSTLSNSNEQFSTTNLSKNKHIKTVSGQTPLFVTITMANSTKTTNSKSKSKSRNRSSSSSSTNRKRNSSSTKINKKLSQEYVNSALVTCGSVELAKKNSNSKSNKSESIHQKPITAEAETSTGTAVLTIIKNLNKKADNLNIDYDLNTTSSSSSSHQLLENLDETNSNDTKSITISNGQSIIQITKSANLTKKSSSKLSNNLNENQIKKLISSKTSNNQSIGDMSIGLDSLSNQDLDQYSDNHKLNLNINKNLNLNEDRSDRDSSSNKAIASESIKKFSIKEDLDSKSELKSNYTINSLPVPDADNCSVSILSEKSINPSVTALIGSIK